jgi:hypothetical protein
MTLISPNQVTGGAHTLWVRDTGTGNLYQFSDIEAGIPDPAAAAVRIGTGFTSDQYPVLASDGDIQDSGHPDLWALTSATATPAQALEVYPGTTLAGGQAFGQPIPLTTAGWGANIVSLDNNSTAYNSAGLIEDGLASPASFDGNGHGYSAEALAATTLSPGYCSQQPPAWATAQACSASSGISWGSLIESPSAGTFQFPAAGPGVRGNFAADGQVVAAPIAVNYPAQTIRFLGAATNATGGESTGTVTITYTDGSVQRITIGLGNWDAAATTSDNVKVASCPYRDHVGSGPHTESVPVSMFSTAAYALTVPSGQQIASITLPRTVSSGQMHIFSVAVN